MSAPSLADIAKVTADDFRRAHEADVAPALARDLAVAIELALLTAVRAERRDCAAACTRRADLWQTTADRPDTSDPLRAEARSRANEALYLADVLATRV
jgi:hypothetical protein